VMGGFFAERGYLKLPFVIMTACSGAYTGQPQWRLLAVGVDVPMASRALHRRAHKSRR